MQVTRWQRYGKDRLHVNEADGHDPGWWDLVEDAAHPTTPEAEDSPRSRGRLAAKRRLS